MLGDALLVKPVTRPLEAGGNKTQVALPPGGWYDLFTGEYHEGGGEIEVDTPLHRFPALIRAGSIVPVATGAHSAADLPVPARELTIYAGADGAFDLYDDTGDGPVDGAVLPLRYDDAEKVLTLGDCHLPEPVDIAVRLIGPDGSRVDRMVRYRGARMRVELVV